MNKQKNRINLKSNWHLKSSFLVNDPPEKVSLSGYKAENWYPASVPTTVLNCLVKNGVYPDPRVGLNNFLIPDASDEFNERHNLNRYSYLPDKRNPWKDPYWHRTEFVLPADCRTKQWLVFNAINYRAEVWLNGKRIAGPQKMVGAFLRFRYDVTGLLKSGLNCLAVKVYGVDHPSIPATQLKPFQKCRTSENYREIMKDVTFNAVAVGYDCVQEVRDRLMGIWQDVYLEFTGPVDIRDPFVKTKLPLPCTDTAQLTVSVELVNGTDKPQAGVLKGVLAGKTVFRKPLELKPAETKEIVLLPEDHPRLNIDNPRLWWPAGYGEQPLYKLAVSFEQDGAVSDRETVIFGIREVTKVLHELDGDYGLRVQINGQKIFSRGGYLLIDNLLDADLMGEERLEAEFKYLRAANLNTFSMEDLPNPPDIFFDLCDRYGLMFWHCFHQCHWLSKEDNPLDHDLLEKCDRDIVKRYRNHPGIVAYMCMNEGQTLQDQYERWRRSCLELDGTRILIPCGYCDGADHRKMAEWMAAETPVGANDAQPKSYTWKPHRWYYDMVRNDRSWMFKMESGSASLPPLESLKKFIPDIDTKDPDSPYPLNATWAHHGVNDYYEEYDKAIRRRYGEPESVADYCWKAHLVTADQHRAMFEAVHHRKWDITSGFWQWKLNSCWPDVQWQLYDYYLRPAVSFYYIKKACEPLHIQLSPAEHTVAVVNNTLQIRKDLRARVLVFDFNLKLLWEKRERCSVPADCCRDLFDIPPLEGLTPIYFVKLELADGRTPVSDNFYWLSARPESDDRDCFAGLNKVPRVKLEVSHRCRMSGAEGVVRVKLKNPTKRLAFFIRAALTRGDNGEEILPVYWDDNYFSLLPGELKVIRAAFAGKALAGTIPKIKVEGWNIVKEV